MLFEEIDLYAPVKTDFRKQNIFYKEGLDAYNKGIPREKCPYRPNSEPANLWLMGWSDIQKNLRS